MIEEEIIKDLKYISLSINVKKQLLDYIKQLQRGKKMKYKHCDKCGKRTDLLIGDTRNYLCLNYNPITKQEEEYEKKLKTQRGKIK